MSSKDIAGDFVETVFESRYQRNNKKHSLKNLRCFPSCGFRHKERGFCGRSVLFKSSRFTERKFYCFAEFMSCEESGLVGCSIDGLEKLDVEIGTIIPFEKARKRCRTRSEPTLPWLQGEELTERSSNDSSIFEFNKQRRGWHYGWQSNKHTCDTQHCFRVYLFERVKDMNTGETTSEPEETESIICRLIVDSNRFMLFCRRRRRFYMNPSAPLSEPSKKLRLDPQRSAANNALLKIDLLLKDLLPMMKAVKSGNHSNSLQGNEKQSMLYDLAKYLENENSFKSMMNDFLSFEETILNPANFLDNSNYSEFLKKVDAHIQTYRRTRNISLSEFDVFFKNPKQAYSLSLAHNPQETAQGTSLFRIKSESSLSFDSLSDDVPGEVPQFEDVAEMVSNNFNFVQDKQPFMGIKQDSSSIPSTHSSIFDAELDGLLTEANLLTQFDHIARSADYARSHHSSRPVASNSISDVVSQYNLNYNSHYNQEHQQMFNDLTRMDRYLDNFEDYISQLKRKTFDQSKK